MRKCSRVSECSECSVVEGLTSATNYTTRAREAKLLHRAQRCDFLDELNHKQTRQGQFDAAMWHLDHPIPGTELYLNPSDDGEGAARLYAAIETAPLWQRLWVSAYLKLKPNGKRILRALMVDWRSDPAARIAGVSQPTVDRWKKIFKIDFAQCFRAWKRDLTG